MKNKKWRKYNIDNLNSKKIEIKNKTIASLQILPNVGTGVREV